MLARKIYNVIEQHFVNKEQEIILVDRSRQVGKTYIIRKVGESSFKNFVEINMVNDSEGERLFAVVNAYYFFVYVCITYTPFISFQDLLYT